LNIKNQREEGTKMPRTRRLIINDEKKAHIDQGIGGHVFVEEAGGVN
jgi:hypothetical protein